MAAPVAQGSGISIEVELCINMVARHPKLKNPTVVVITDRNELDGQLFEGHFPQPAAGRVASLGAEEAELLGVRAAGHVKQLWSFPASPANGFRGPDPSP
ncbi:hypothetical protein [Arthrobacter sp. UYEF3]|uniref:hypothetical protein n=1 Tax=Arthrobacter sp. UYEF3 TaxID=1756365 RepID=UPI0033921942